MLCVTSSVTSGVWRDVWCLVWRLAWRLAFAERLVFNKEGRYLMWRHASCATRCVVWLVMSMDCVWWTLCVMDSFVCVWWTAMCVCDGQLRVMDSFVWWKKWHRSQWSCWQSGLRILYNYELALEVEMSPLFQHTRELISARKSSHKYNNKDLSHLR